MPATIASKPELPIIAPPIDLDRHEAAKRETQKLLDAARPELLRCLDPNYAARRELEKPHYQWQVQASWVGHGDDGLTRFEADEKVVAQSEKDAWAKLCDKVGRYPNFRDVKPVITRLKKVAASALLAGTTDEDSAAPLPTVRLTAPKNKARY